MAEEKKNEVQEIRDLVKVLLELDPVSLMLAKNSADTLHMADMMKRQSREKELVQQQEKYKTNGMSQDKAKAAEEGISGGRAKRNCKSNGVSERKKYSTYPNPNTGGRGETPKGIIQGGSTATYGSGKSRWKEASG